MMRRTPTPTNLGRALALLGAQDAGRTLRDAERATSMFLDVVGDLCRWPIDTPERLALLHRVIDRLRTEGRSSTAADGPFTGTVEDAIDVVLEAAIQDAGQPFDAAILALVRQRIIEQRPRPIVL